MAMSAAEMVAVMPKACPRCRGRMLVEDDWYGKFGNCIACGYVHDLDRVDPADLEEEERQRSGKQRRRQPSHGTGGRRVEL